MTFPSLGRSPISRPTRASAHSALSSRRSWVTCTRWGGSLQPAPIRPVGVGRKFRVRTCRSAWGCGAKIFTDQRGHRAKFDIGGHTRCKRRFGSTVLHLPARTQEARRDQLCSPSFALVLFGGVLVAVAISGCFQLTA